MKKLITLSLVALFSLFTIAPMVGCSGDDEKDAKKEEKKEDAKKDEKKEDAK